MRIEKARHKRSDMPAAEQRRCCYSQHTV
jgi:hypothetical protein